jgi:hypothetical protein
MLDAAENLASSPRRGNITRLTAYMEAQCSSTFEKPNKGCVDTVGGKGLSFVDGML